MTNRTGVVSEEYDTGVVFEEYDTELSRPVELSFLIQQGTVYDEDQTGRPVWSSQKLKVNYHDQLNMM